jgi:small conductance mechanosensitive channel
MPLDLATALMDIYTAGYIAASGLGILAAEELISFVIRRAARAARAGSTVLRDIKTGMRAIALVLILSNVLNLAGLSSLFTTLTISGVLAVAVSLALQTTLSNVISGLLLFNDGALRLGDTIEYGGTKGKVVRVGLRNTWIKTDPGSLVVVSNSSLSNGPLTNHTATERLKKKYAFD